MSTHKDQSLVKIVHQETYRSFPISAMMSPFGGLSVVIHRPTEPHGPNPDNEVQWNGFNILSARSWIDKIHKEFADRDIT